MKNAVLLFIILIFNVFSVFTIQASNEDVELKSFINPNQTITYYGSDMKVTIPSSPKHYKSLFKAAYITTYENKDLSALIVNDTEQFKIEYNQILNTLQDNHMNVVIFEVSPLLDAFYPSKINPSSQYLTGKEGNPLELDPLEWMIEETHQRNMEFHAGVNPFLISNQTIDGDVTIASIVNSLAPSNYAFKNQGDIVVGNDQRLYLNPGIPEVQSYFISTVTEIIQNYLIDSIHINSSIYPITGMDPVYDKEMVNNPNDLDEFRKAKVIELFRKISNTINTYNVQTERSIQLGVTYDMKRDFYIDMDYLVNHNLLDYLVARLDYSFEEAEKGFADYAKEWSTYMQESDVNLYIGLDISFGSENYSRELESKFLYLQKYNSIKGLALNGVVNLDANKTEVFKNLTSTLFNSSILLPAVKNVYVPTVNNVNRLSVEWLNDQVHINWAVVPKAKYYILYRFNSEQVVQINDLENPTSILAVIKHDEVATHINYVDDSAQLNNSYQYMLSVVDYANNESDIPTIRSIDLTFDQDMTFKLILFSVISLVGISVIGYTSYLILKK
jgi:uncharacterized lipoprotein YddW (UPF0748 family)